MKKNNKEVKETKQPTLTCVVTGATRKTSQVYLDAKARKISKAKNLAPAIEQIKANYASRPVIKALHEGKTIAAIRKELGSKMHGSVDVEALLKFNGKHASVKAKGKSAAVEA